MHEQIELAMLLYTYARSSRRKEISTTVDYISASPPAAYRPRVLTSSVVCWLVIAFRWLDRRMNSL